MKEILNASVMKATAGAFLAALAEPEIQKLVAGASTNRWVPLVVDLAAGAIVILPSIPNYRTLQLTAGAVFFASALSRLLGQMSSATSGWAPGATVPAPGAAGVVAV